MADPFTTYKLIVLYMAKHATQALTNSQISEFILTGNIPIISSCRKYCQS